MIYEQSTGFWKSGDGKIILARCYSGAGEGKNNPDKQAVHDVGPIPRGWYTLQAPEFTKTGETSPHGPYVIPLKPDPGNDMDGDPDHDTEDRGGFLAHGDNVHFPGTASKGCVIPLNGRVTGKVVLAGRMLREALWEYGKTEGQRLEVVSGPWPLPVIAS